mmetsp:Transcript_29110/g.38287  ORF Transcript_29110/g.38287 Transcript_29110/m.38287 type:complete len:103 (+) Transcript_29110:194-502(+)
MPRNFVWFPNFYMVLASAPNKLRPNQAIFKVSPRMTKIEIKQYLTKIYNLPVIKVMTQNYLGKRKRIIGTRKMAFYKRPDFKRAIVTLDASKADNMIDQLTT